MNAFTYVLMDKSTRLCIHVSSYLANVRKQKYRATNSYQGSPPPPSGTPLRFHEGIYSPHIYFLRLLSTWFMLLWLPISYYVTFSFLSRCAGDQIEVVNRDNQHWWLGCRQGQQGYFPATYVKLRQVSSYCLSPQSISVGRFLTAV